MSADAGEPGVEHFDFEWNPRYRGLLSVLGVGPSNSCVTVTQEQLSVRFGRWSLDTPLSNVVGAHITRDYAWYKAVGARLSFADRGVTFGTDTACGVCVCMDEPVAALLPGDGLRHPGVTLTVADPQRFADVIEDRIG